MLVLVVLAGAGVFLVLGGDGDETVEASGAGGSGDEGVSEETTSTVDRTSSTTATTSTTEATTTTTQPETVPNLVGMTLDEAQARVRGTGMDLRVVNVADDETPTGTILKQTPEAESAFEAVVTVNVARPSIKTYLTSMEPVERTGSGIEDSGNATLNTQIYTQAFWMQTCSRPWGVEDRSQSVGYDLSRAYTRFRSVVGMADNAVSGSWAKFEVFGDGRLLVEVNGSLGAPSNIDVDVSGVLRLTLRASGIGCESYTNSSAYAVFADPHLTSAPPSNN